MAQKGQKAAFYAPFASLLSKYHHSELHNYEGEPFLKREHFLIFVSGPSHQIPIRPELVRLI